MLFSFAHMQITRSSEEATNRIPGEHIPSALLSSDSDQEPSVACLE